MVAKGGSFHVDAPKAAESAYCRKQSNNLVSIVSLAQVYSFR